jgi:hypothetical protein
MMELYCPFGGCRRPEIAWQDLNRLGGYCELMWATEVHDSRTEMGKAEESLVELPGWQQWIARCESEDVPLSPSGLCH